MLFRFGLKLGLCRFHIPCNDRIVFVRVFPMCDVAMAIRADSSNIQRVIGSSISERPNVMNFEIRLSIATHEWCGIFAALTISA